MGLLAFLRAEGAQNTFFVREYVVKQKKVVWLARISSISVQEKKDGEHFIR